MARPVPYTTSVQRNVDALNGQAVQVLIKSVPANIGDILYATVSQEFTTQESYPDGRPAFVWVELFLSSDPAAVTAPNSAQLFAARGGTNIMPGQHHFCFERTGWVKIPSAGTWFVIFAVTWDPDAGMLPGRIEQGESYGKLDVLNFVR
jgi:hypothetical protein